MFGVDLIRDPMGQAVDEAWRKATKNGWRLSDGSAVSPPRVPSLDAVAHCIDEDVDMNRHYSRETLRAVLQRFRSLAGHAVFGQTGTSLKDLLAAGEATILLLAEAPDDIRRVFVSFLTRRLLQERAAASAVAKESLLRGEQEATTEGIPPTWFLVDEAQNLLPSERSTSATDALIRFVREGRNHGLSFVVTTQQPSAIDPRIMAQVDTLFAHQLVTAKDVRVVTENLKSPVPRSIRQGPSQMRLNESIPLLDVGQALVSSPELPRTIFLAVRPRVSIHGGFEA